MSALPTDAGPEVEADTDIDGGADTAPDADNHAFPALAEDMPPRHGHTIIGLERSWVNGRVTLEWPVHLFAGFGAQPSLELGAFSYSSSHISPHVQSIGRYCSIAEGVTFGHQEHPTHWLSTSSFTYDRCFMGPGPNVPLPNNLYATRSLADTMKPGRIIVGNDVWIGFNAYIRAGTKLGDGCVVAAHAVVTRDVPPFAIVAGNPARIVRYRFDPVICRELAELEWWQYEFTRFAELDVADVPGAIRRLRALVADGLRPFKAELTILTAGEPTPALACERAGAAPIAPA